MNEGERTAEERRLNRELNSGRLEKRREGEDGSRTVEDSQRRKPL